MKNITKFHILLLTTLTILSGCSQSTLNSYPKLKIERNIKYSVNNTEIGKASYYADKYQGRLTANGERFNQNARTAAHKKLKFGTKVKVTNRRNGRSVVVRINDRGPFIKGRIIDLSKSAFSAIANQRVGVIDVKVEILR